MKGAIRYTAMIAISGMVSIRAPREGGDPQCPRNAARRGVSIRAPREGGDSRNIAGGEDTSGFNPRPP